MIKIPKDIRDMIIEECGLYNIIISLGSGVAGGALIFTLMLSYLMNKNNEEVL